MLGKARKMVVLTTSWAAKSASVTKSAGPLCWTLVLPIQPRIVAPAARTAFSQVSRYVCSSLMMPDYMQSIADTTVAI